MCGIIELIVYSLPQQYRRDHGENSSHDRGAYPNATDRRNGRLRINGRRRRRSAQLPGVMQPRLETRLFGGGSRDRRTDVRPSRAGDLGSRSRILLVDRQVTRSLRDHAV